MIMLFVLIIVTSFTEVLSIGSALPFLSVLISPDSILTNPSLRPVFEMFTITSPEQLLVPITIAFISAALIAGAMRLFLLWFSVRFSFSMGADMKVAAYERALYQPYAIHTTRNSSELITGIGKAGIITSVFTNILNFLSSGILMIAVLSALLTFNAIVTLSLFGGFGSIYALITYFTRKKLLRNSQSVARESVQALKAMQEGFGGIRDVLIDGTQSIYCRVFRNADFALNRANGNNQFLSQSPAFGIQALGIVFIALLALVLSRQGSGITQHIPMLGALVYGSQRLLPALQQLYSAWSTIQGQRKSIDDALDMLEQPLPEYLHHTESEMLPFTKDISLSNLSFRYNSKLPWILRNLDLSIKKGSCVGFIGETGSGKSTLLDLIMGLLQPTKGSLQIDGLALGEKNIRTWQSHIAHVPQSIFLSDASIEENIAFGIPKEKIDHERVLTAARNAQIADLIESWPAQYKTFVGERGIRLSGGQRQRIGIARALYKEADVIILDEATSALDNDTELAVMQAIECLGKELTVLIIAHRLTTLKNCTQIVELGEGGIKRILQYEDIMPDQEKSAMIHA